MQDLLILLIKYRNVLVFVILELITLSLVVRYNNSQREIFYGSSSLLVGNVYKQKNNFSQFVHLAEVNQSLAAENSTLRRLLSIEPQDSMKLDTFFLNGEKPLFNYRTAQVINNSVNKTKNVLTINKGAVDGIKPRMGVVDHSGLVGIVKNVGEKFSVIMSILNTNAIISCKVKDKGYFGPLSWDAKDVFTFTLNDVPNHAPISKNDTIITSGYSYIFPEGIVVGTVDSLWSVPGNDYFVIKVKLVNDLSKVEHVYPIENMNLTQLDSLKMQ